MNDFVGTIIFDVDGTICPIKKKDEKYEDIVPYASIVIKSYYILRVI